MQEQQIAVMQTVIKSLATVQAALATLMITPEEAHIEAERDLTERIERMRKEDEEAKADLDPHFSHAEDQMHQQGRDLPKLADEPTPAEAPSLEALAMDFLRENVVRGDLAGEIAKKTIIDKFVEYLSVSHVTYTSVPPKPSPTESVSLESLVQGFLRNNSKKRLDGMTAETILVEFADYISKDWEYLVR